MKTMCPLGYHHNGFVATRALGHMMNRTSCAQEHELPQSCHIYSFMYIYNVCI